MADLEKRVEKLQGKVGGSNAVIELLNEERNDLADRCAFLKERRRQDLSSLHAATENVAVLADVNEGLLEEREELMERIRGLEGENAALAEEVASLIKENGVLRGRIDRRRLLWKSEREEKKTENVFEDDANGSEGEEWVKEDSAWDDGGDSAEVWDQLAGTAGWDDGKKDTSRVERWVADVNFGESARECSTRVECGRSAERGGASVVLGGRKEFSRDVPESPRSIGKTATDVHNWRNSSELSRGLSEVLEGGSSAWADNATKDQRPTASESPRMHHDNNIDVGAKNAPKGKTIPDSPRAVNAKAQVGPSAWEDEAEPVSVWADEFASASVWTEDTVDTASVWGGQEETSAGPSIEGSDASSVRKKSECPPGFSAKRTDSASVLRENENSFGSSAERKDAIAKKVKAQDESGAERARKALTGLEWRDRARAISSLWDTQTTGRSQRKRDDKVQRRSDRKMAPKDVEAASSVRTDGSAAADAQPTNDDCRAGNAENTWSTDGDGAAGIAGNVWATNVDGGTGREENAWSTEVDGAPGSANNDWSTVTDGEAGTWPWD